MGTLLVMFVFGDINVYGYVCLWVHQCECLSMGTLLVMFIFGYINVYVCLWEHSWLCLSLGTSVCMFVYGNIVGYVCLWVHQCVCLSMGTSLVMFVFGYIIVYVCQWEHRWLCLSLGTSVCMFVNGNPAGWLCVWVHGWHWGRVSIAVGLATAPRRWMGVKLTNSLAMVHYGLQGEIFVGRGRGRGWGVGRGETVQIKDADGRVVHCDADSADLGLLAAVHFVRGAVYSKYQHSFCVPPFPVQLEVVIASGGKSVVGVQVCLLDAGHINVFCM